MSVIGARLGGLLVVFLIYFIIYGLLYRNPKPVKVRRRYR